VTKKEIVRKIAEQIEETQLKTKEIVQRTFDAIVDTLLTERRIELRNFGVFEVKLRRPRKARNPKTEEAVDVPAKFVVTFKPGKEMEEKVRELKPRPEDLERLQAPKPAKKAAVPQAAATPAPLPPSSPEPATMPATATGPSPSADSQPASGSDSNGTGDSAESAGKKKRARKPAQA